jgi:hypothetical protein
LAGRGRAIAIAAASAAHARARRFFVPVISRRASQPGDSLLGSALEIRSFSTIPSVRVFQGGPTRMRGKWGDRKTRIE